jgi:hypothetical protein
VREQSLVNRRPEPDVRFSELDFLFSPQSPDWRLTAGRAMHALVGDLPYPLIQTCFQADRLSFADGKPRLIA